MSEILIVLGKLMASTALLYGFYWLVLRNKASYKTARLYLLMIPFVSLMMSGLTLKVLPEENVLPLETLPLETLPQPIHIAEGSKNLGGETVPAEVSAPLPHQEGPGVSLEGMGEGVLALLAVVSFVLVALALYHMAALYVMGRRMRKLTTKEGYPLVYSEKIPAPCSFGKTIFMPTSIAEGQRDPILRHEKAHIRHGHFVDVWVMELMTRLMWFNPFLWMTRNELRNVHEFEADHDVLTGGVDVNAYQTLLLAQVMDNGSVYANGFNHSFIRRRFIEMKRSTAGTLGRWGKAGMGLWVALLFCGFTFAKSDPTVPKATVPELGEPQPFVIEGRIVENWGVTDSTFYIYLSDEYMHINTDKPAAKVTLKNGKFHYEIPLKKMTAARIQNASKGSVGRDFFFVPGEKAELSIYSNSMIDLQPDRYDYVRKLDRSLTALRNATDWQSPSLPKLQGKRWENVSSQPIGYPDLMVREVVFGKDETVLRIAPTNFIFNGMKIHKESYITDDKGRKYKLRRALYGKIDEPCGADIYTFGGYYAFDRVPDDVKELNFMDTNSGTSTEQINSEGDTIVIHGAGILHIKPIPKTEPQQPNFRMDITVSQGINDSGYLIEILDDPAQGRGRQVADIAVVDRKCSFATYVDEPKMAHVTATFPDGSICSAYVWFPFVPGEKATVKVKNGTFELDGTTFYNQFQEADDLLENADRYTKPEESEALKLDYLKKHITEEGCIMRYWQYEELPREMILKLIPAKIKNGRFKKFFAGTERYKKNRN